MESGVGFAQEMRFFLKKKTTKKRVTDSRGSRLMVSISGCCVLKPLSGTQVCV